MSYEFTISLSYSAGTVLVNFEGDSYPENWSEIQAEAEMAVQDELYEMNSIHEWQDSFETAKEYSMPGMTVEPEVGTLLINDGDIELNLSIDSLHDCNWE